MASIQKLSIRGVRAFSPDDEEQVIAFGFPLTIIIGKNGCGKTTIIEALKYSVTGALPPGNKSGQAFVHDPKSVGTSQVKAAVKLRYQNRAGKTMVVTRCMELTQKKTNMQFKQLDGTIRTNDENGNKVALSHKCSELDRQIPQMLGVSKAILEHVVFCHQEDSSWPLMEGAVLKKRFDDIFDSTRYVKALEALKDTRKNFQGKVKDLKADLEGLTAHKHAAGQYRHEFERCEEQMSKIHDQITAYDEEIEEAKEKCNEYEEKLMKIREIEEEMNEKARDFQVYDSTEGAFRKNLNEDMTAHCSIDDLQDMVCAHDREMQGDAKKLEQAKNDVRKLEALIVGGKDRNMKLSGEKGLLLGEKKIYDENLNQRVTLMEDMATKYGLELSFSQTQQTDVMSTQQSRLSSDLVNDMMLSQGTAASTVNLTIEDLDAFNGSVDKKRNELQYDLKSYQKQVQKDYDALQSEISDIKAKIASNDNETDRLKAENSQIDNDLKALPTTRSTIRETDINAAKNTAEELIKRVNNLNRHPDREAVPKQIKEKEVEVNEIQKEIDVVNDVLKDLRRCAEDQNKIKLLKEQLESDVNDIGEIKTENEYLLSKYDVEVPDPLEAGANDIIKDLVDEYTTKVDNVSEDLTNGNRDLKESSNSFSKQSSILNHKKNTLKDLEAKLQHLKREDSGYHQIRNVIKNLRTFESTQFSSGTISPTIEPQQLLEHISQKMTTISAEINPQSRHNILQKLKEMSIGADRSSVKCPCCEQKISGGVAESFLKQRLDIFVDDLIRFDEKTAKLNQSALKNYANWRTLVSRCSNDWMDYKRISEEITSLKSQIDEEEEKVKDLEKDHDDIQRNVNDNEEKLSSFNEMKNLAQQLKDSFDVISKKSQKIDELNEQCELDAPKAQDRSLDSTELELNSKMKQKDILASEISNLNKKMSQMNEDINDTNNRLLKAQKAVESKEKSFALEKETSEKRKKFREQKNKNDDKMDKIRTDANKLQKDMKRKESEKTRKRQITDEEMEKKSNLCILFNKDAEKIDTLTAQIDDFKSGDKLHRLSKIDTDINNINQEINKFEDDLDKLTPQVKSLQNKVDDRESHKKNLNSNIELLQIMEKKQKVQDEITLLNEKIGDFDADTVMADNDSMQKTIRKIEVEKSRCEGKKETLRSSQREVQRQLRTKQYKDIDERHRVKMIEVETNSLAVQDLEVYYNALDKALLRYHGMKIQEINKIIKELWSSTYRGEDITNIRLTSDQETNKRSTRSYNYRVVMTKGTTELDMRGRCSAGQRVLASLVIRLALAETFGLNFGVMALDEPTTNLDFENKRGLAISLARIISQRSTQDNFQLVVITHDEDFVGMLKSELSAHTVSMPEKYFLVFRREANDGCYYSKVKAIDWEDM